MRVGYYISERGPCSHVRCVLPAQAMYGRGHAVAVMQADKAEDLSLQAVLDTKFDVIVGLRVTTEIATSMWQQFKDNGIRLVYDLDDDFFSIPADNPAHNYYQGEVLERVRKNLTLADAVTVTTEKLAESIREINPNVIVLPNMIDEALLHWQRPHRERVTVGWSGTLHHDADWAGVIKPINAFFNKNPDVDLHIVGADYREFLKQPHARYSPWTSADTFHTTLDFDIGLVPLAWLPFNRSKSDVKVLDMAALGIPSVASDFGPYTVIEHGRTGYLVNHDHEWKKYLAELNDNPQLRAEMGANAKDWAATRTIQANIGLWEDVYNQVLSTH